MSQLAILAMTLTTVYDVFMRHVFKKPTIWAVELNAALLVIITFLAAARLVHQDQHINMDALYKRLSRNQQRIVSKVVDLMVLLFCAVLLWISVTVTISVYKARIYSAGAFRFPMWIPYSSIVVGSFLMLLEYLVRLLSPLPAGGDRA